MRWFYQKIWMPLYGKWVLRFIQKNRIFQYAGIWVKVPVGVFHPGLFFTTTIFIDSLQAVDLQGKKLLDVGTGSGLLGLFAAKKGARVSAIDINPKAVVACRENATANQLDISALESDLFDKLPKGNSYDLVLINPPYFAAPAKDLAARAFFAGSNLEYFEKLFTTTKGFLSVGAPCICNKLEDGEPYTSS